MGNLTNQYVSQSYQGLLKLDNSNTGVTATLQYVTDGLGNKIPMLASTSSVVITGSFRGDGSGLTGITVDSGSLVTTSSFNSYTSSNDNRVNSLISATGSYATTSSLTALSQSIASTDLAQNNRLTSIEGVTGSFASTSSLNSYTLTSSFNAYTSSTNGRLNSLESATASLQNQINQKLDTGSFNAYTSSNDAKVNSLIAATASYVTETESGSFLITGSASGNVLTFTKGNGSQFNLTIDTGSNSNRNGLITTGSAGLTQQITGSLNVGGTITATSASFTYVTTVFETASVIYSSGSNQLGDASDDTQTLVGDVNIPSGNLRVDNISNWTTGGDLIIGTQGGGDLILNSGGPSISLLRTGSNQWVSIDGNTEVTGTLKVTGGITGSLQGTASFASNALSASQAQNAVSASQSQNAVSASQAQNAVTASYANDINRTGLITTGSAAGTQSITGSVILSGSAGIELDVKGDVLITGSVIMSGSAGVELDVKGDTTVTGSVNILGPLNLRGNETISGSLITNTLNDGLIRILTEAQSSSSLAVPFGYISASLPVSQSNLIFGTSTGLGGNGQLPNGQTGSIVISGSNNIILAGGNRANTLVTAGTYGYLNGAVNFVNTYPTLTTSSILRPSINNSNLNAAVAFAFTTSSLGVPQFTNNNVQAAVTINHQSGSLNYIQNINVGPVTTTANNITLPFLTTIQQNYFGGSGLFLNHISSSITTTNNIIGGAAFTVTNLVSSSVSATNNGLTLGSNLVIGQANGVWVSGSNPTNRRNITSNIIGGVNTAVSSSQVGAEAHLYGTIVYGQNLIVSASNALNNGGSAFFGRYNDTTTLSDSQQIVFAVGTGTAVGNRRTGLYVTSGSLVGVSGSFDIKGNSTITGSVNILGETVMSSSLAAATPLYVSGTMQTQRLQFDGNPFNSSPASNLAALRYSSDNQTFQYTNYDKAQITTQSFIDQIVNTGSLSTRTRFGATYAGTTTQIETVNDNGTRRINLNSDATIVTGSLSVSNLPTSTGSFFVTTDSTGQLTKATPLDALPALMGVGAFYSTGSYTATANTSGSFIFDTSLNVNSVQLTNSGSKVLVDRSGTYNIQFSTQISQGSGEGNIAIWLKKNGSNVADTATYITVPSNHKDVLALNLWDTATSGSYYELAYQSDSNNTSFETVAATGNIPRSPSIILTVNQVR